MAKINQRTRKKKHVDEDLKRMTRAAEMYFRESRKQQVIADELLCSVMEVSRLLREAEKHKIVEIKVNSQHGARIRETLLNRYKLKDLRISPAFADNEQTREALAEEAKEFFDEVVMKDHTTAGTTVGISGGRTIHKMVDLIEQEPRQIKIYPLTGIWRDLQINYVDSGVLVHSLWIKCKDAAQAFWFPIEPLTSRTTKQSVLDQRKMYLKNRQIKTVFEAANNVDLALIGVGPLRERSATVRQLKSIGITYEYLKRRGAVGIAAGVWYDKNAKPVVDDYFLSVPLDAFKKLSRRSTKRVVIVAGGPEKVEAIDILLRNRVCNALITDSRTASLLAAKVGNKSSPAPKK